jgi:hypothetical protein
MRASASSTMVGPVRGSFMTNAGTSPAAFSLTAARVASSVSRHRRALTASAARNRTSWRIESTISYRQEL